MQCATRDHSNFHKKPVKPAVEFSDPHLTEQQHRADCDATRIMQRMAAGVVQPQGFIYGERDMTLSRSDVHRDAVRLREWYESLPPSIRRTYKDAAAVVQAIHAGDLLFDSPAEAPAATPVGAVAAAAASDSAPVSKP